MTRRLPVDPAAAAHALRSMAKGGAHLQSVSERDAVHAVSAPSSPTPDTPTAEPPPTPTLDLDRVRRMADISHGLMRIQQAAAHVVADEAFADVPSPDDPVEAGLWQALIQLNRALLAHPIAVRAACDALRAEGRQYAESAEGAALRRRLQASPAIARASVIWRSTTMGAFEGDPSADGGLPSTWLALLAGLTEWEDLEGLLGRLAGGAP